MWHILKAEFNYHKKIFLGFFGFLPFICFHAINPILEDLSANYLIFMLIFLMLQNWNTFRNKENRERQHIRLPLSIKKIALARIFMIIIPCLGFIGFYSLIYSLLAGPIDHIRLLISFSMILLGFSIYFIIRDLFLSFFRKIGFTKNRIVIGLVLIMLGLNLLGIFFFTRTTNTGAPPVNMELLAKFVRFLQGADMYVATKFIVSSLALASSTLFSFGRRRSYLD